MNAQQHSTCPGSLCRFYHIQEDYSKYDPEKDVWDKFTAYFCLCPELQIGKNGQPRRNRQVPGGSPIGLVCWNCKGTYFKPRS